MTFVPRLATVPTMAMEMPEAIMAYSIAVAPLLSPRNDGATWQIALVADLNMASCLLAFLITAS